MVTPPRHSLLRCLRRIPHPWWGLPPTHLHPSAGLGSWCLAPPGLGLPPLRRRSLAEGRLLVPPSW